MQAEWPMNPRDLDRTGADAPIFDATAFRLAPREAAPDRELTAALHAGARDTSRLVRVQIGILAGGAPGRRGLGPTRGGSSSPLSWAR